MKYRTVVIDPPWPVEPVSRSATELMGGSPLSDDLPYKTMSLEEIRAFNIDQFADQQCALFMWTTQGFLKDGLAIVDNWGFKFGKLLTWDKRKGINWLGFALNTEFVIFAYRGKYPIKVLKGKSIPAVFSACRTRHSEKPASFYAKILDLTPEPRIDVFARKRHYGFDAYGDQAEEEPITIEQFG